VYGAATLNSNNHCESDNDEFVFSVNIFAGDTGYYEVAGCGLMPTLAIKQGTTYSFNQADETNWYHPLGFAYAPDGALSANDELEKVVAAPGGADAGCAATQSCQAPNYKLDGAALRSDPLDPEDFGLDEYEGNYFSGGRGDWIDAGTFTVDVEITDTATTEFFYFCHIHSGMTGRAVVYEPDGSAPKTTASPVEIPYTYDFDNADAYSTFDQNCGTYNTSAYSGAEACPYNVFICNDGADGTTASDFATCMSAIDCAMQEEMRINLGDDPLVTFIHQMIPHHRNAVNMAKILIKENPSSLQLATSYGDAGDMETLMWEIVNQQNAQISLMENWLRDNNYPANAACDYEPPLPDQSDASTLFVCSVALMLATLF
jgi:hypothetical protein